MLNKINLDILELSKTRSHNLHGPKGLAEWRKQIRGHLD